MAAKAENLNQGIQIVPVNEAVDGIALRVPARRMLGSGGTSVLIHLVALLVLSLIMIVQQESQPPISATAEFSELLGDADAALEVSEPDILEIQTTPLNLPDATSIIAPNSGAAADVKIDLSAFASNNTGSSGSGLPSAVEAIASGIKGRVEQAGGKSGEVQFSLAWSSVNDVDLHVITPSGEHISFSHRRSACKGMLDVDMNARQQNSENYDVYSQEPVENIRWAERSAPIGRYTVIVNQYEWRRGQKRDPFQLLVKLGDKTQLIEDEVSAWKSISIHRFQYIKSSLSQQRQVQLALELTALQKREEEQGIELYEAALPLPAGSDRDRKMMNVIIRFPHTDASILAMQQLTPVEKK